jgi:fluoride exporter
MDPMRFTTGLLGGCTTFFAFSLDAALIHERSDLGLAAVYLLASGCAAVGGAASWAMNR